MKNYFTTAKQVKLLLLIFFILFCSLPNKLDAQIQVPPDNGIEISQVSYDFGTSLAPFSIAGYMKIDLDLLILNTGLGAGFINVLHPSLGWVVQNIPVQPNPEYPLVGTTFQISNQPQMPLEFVDLYIIYEPQPRVNSPVSTNFDFYLVGQETFTATGFEGPITGFVPSPPTPGIIPFIPTGPTGFTYQPGHTNVQTAHNQCLPASVANSLQWLEDTYEEIEIPHPHVPGLNGGNSLVGQLDSCMNRTSTSRESGNPVGGKQGLEGKLRYLAKNGITNIHVKHMGLAGTFHGDSTYTVTANGTTVASTPLGSTFNPAKLIQEIQEGEDVELGYLYDTGGGHFVEVVGAGTILGIPYICHVSDHKQTNEDNGTAGDGTPDNEGTNCIDYAFLFDTDSNGTPDLVGGFGNNADAVVMYSQSPKAPPPSIHSATPLSMTSALVEWDGVPDAVFYQVRHRIKGTSAWTVSGTANSQRLLNNLTPNKYYQYKLRSQSVDGTWSDFSDIGTFYTSICEVPTGVASVYLDNVRMRIRWDNTDEIKGKVRYREVGTPTWFTKNSTPGNNYVYITGLTPNAQYQYRVRSNCEGNSWSAYTESYYHDLSGGGARIAIDDLSTNPRIYPNPANDILNVSFNMNIPDEVSIIITDVLGKTVRSQMNSYDKGIQTERIDINQLSKGYYFISIHNGDDVQTMKFIKL